MNDAPQTPQSVPAHLPDTPSSGQTTEVAGAMYYVQWVRDAIQARALIGQGWRIAQVQPCHHNRYALLMRAPEGWTP